MTAWTRTFWIFRWDAAHDQDNHITKWRPCIQDILESGVLIADKPHHSTRYPHQRILVFRYQKKHYFLPYVPDAEIKGGFFIKTAFHSSRLEKTYYTS